MAAIDWQGVFPAITTQFDASLGVDLKATQARADALIKAGVNGLVILGTMGENTSLSAEEKRRVAAAVVEAAGGRVPVIAGVAEYTTDEAARFVRDAQVLGVSGAMVLPAMVYAAQEHEIVRHFATVARASDLPLMLYNNPPVYRVNLSLDTIRALAAEKTIVAIKESAEDTRRFTDIINATGERFVLFAGLDDVVVEGLVLGAVGWVSGMANAFPRESLALYRLVRAGRLADALTIYRWFMPLLHLDSRSTLVQDIKLVEEIMGVGSARVRAPRSVPEGEARKSIEAMVKSALAARPKIEHLLG